jgi:hypothetical protein
MPWLLWLTEYYPWQRSWISKDFRAKVLLIRQLLGDYSVFIKYMKVKKSILTEGGNAKFST